MGVAHILELGLGAMTNQQLADMALAEDQAARRARERGDMAAAAAYDRESARLCALLQDHAASPAT